MVRTLQAVVVAALAASAPAAAHASCLARSFFAPQRVLGSNPTIYLFDPMKAGTIRLEAKTAEAALATDAVEVSRYEAYRVLRISVRTSSDFVLTAFRDISRTEAERLMGPQRAPSIKWPITETVASARFEVRTPTERTAVASVTIAGLEFEESEWTCSFQRTRNLAPSVEAPAYRLEWALSAADYRRGQRKHLVLPGARAGTETSVKLGHLDCVGWTFPWEGPDVFVGLVALHADGSETLAAAEPFRIARDQPVPSLTPGPNRP